jgi:hypothetical protein
MRRLGLLARYEQASTDQVVPVQLHAESAYVGWGASSMQPCRHSWHTARSGARPFCLCSCQFILQPARRNSDQDRTPSFWSCRARAKRFPCEARKPGASKTFSVRSPSWRCAQGSGAGRTICPRAWVCHAHHLWYILCPVGDCTTAFRPGVANPTPGKNAPKVKCSPLRERICSCPNDPTPRRTLESARPESAGKTASEHRR